MTPGGHADENGGTLPHMRPTLVEGTPPLPHARPEPGPAHMTGGPALAADQWNSAQGRRLRLQLFERDRKADAKCYWCLKRGLPGDIDYSLGPYTRGGDVWAWSPEHLKPRHLYPQLALEPTNIVAAHFHCNSSRGTKAGVDELGELSRSW